VPRSAAAQSRVELDPPVRGTSTAAWPLFGVSIESGVLRTLALHHQGGVAGAIASLAWGTECPLGRAHGRVVGCRGVPPA